MDTKDDSKEDIPKDMKEHNPLKEAKAEQSAAPKESKESPMPKGSKEDPKDKELTDLKDTLQRLQADFENYKKHADKEKARMRDFSNAELIRKILPILDSFQLALKSTKDNEKFLKGMELIYSQLFSTLENEGLRPIEALGREFNPEYHDALMKEKAEGKEDIILEEFQRGYMLKDKVLRHSRVKVGD